MLHEDGFEIISPGRMTGDGYYESAVYDPEKNRIEIVA
jgi:lactoylglutathione lyase